MRIVAIRCGQLLHRILHRLFGTLGTAAQALGGSMQRLQPRPENAAAYDAAYARYRALFRALTPLFSPQS